MNKKPDKTPKEEKKQDKASEKKITSKETEGKGIGGTQLGTGNEEDTSSGKPSGREVRDLG